MQGVSITNYRVILAATSGRLSGVDIFSLNLARGLAKLGIEAEIVLTKPYYVPPDPMPYPDDIHLSKLPTTGKESWQLRWAEMVNFLESRAPCIYIPNYDWQHSCVSPQLSDMVGIVGVVHSDEDMHYEHVTRLGKYWNKMVAVSQTVADKTRQIDSTYSDRLDIIPYGVVVAEEFPQRELIPDSPLIITYAGRLVSHQKRVFDLVKIMDGLVEKGIPFRFNIIGGGEEQEQFLAACSEHLNQGRTKFWGTLANDKVHAVLLESDVFILTSQFEGLPLSLLEAMGHGCTPVVTAIESGIPEVVSDGENGYLIPIGDINGFVTKLAYLQDNPDLRENLSRQAYETIVKGGYTVMDMAEKYVAVFENLWGQVESGEYERPRGPVLPPPSLNFKSRLPKFVQKILYSVAAGVREKRNNMSAEGKDSAFLRFYSSNIRPVQRILLKISLPFRRLFWKIFSKFLGLIPIFWKIAKATKRIVLRRNK